MILPPSLSVKNGHLHIGQHDTVSLAGRFGTPLYVTDEDRIRTRFREVHDALSSLYGMVRILYAAKANGNPAILSALAAEGAVRYRERHRANVPGSFPFVVYQHRTLLFALVHNTDYFGWIHIDSAGFRRGLPHQPNSGAIRILADGASTTFDFGVSRDDRTWGRRMPTPVRRCTILDGRCGRTSGQLAESS